MVVERYVGEEEVDALWHKYIGSRRIFSGNEVSALRKLKKNNVLPWRTLYTLYLTSKYWRMKRDKVLKRDGNKCVECGGTENLHVDHLVYRGFGKEKMEDLQTLCRKCHSGKTDNFVLGEKSV